MSKFAETISSINSLIMMTITVAILGVLGFSGWMAYDRFLAPEFRAREEAEKELESAREELGLANVALGEARDKVAAQSAMINKQAETIQSQTETIEQQGEQIVVLEEENERLETAMRLLTIDHQLAYIRVLRVGEEEQSGEKYCEVEFVEMTPDGQRLGKPRQYYLSGDKIYVDCWIVKFDDKYIKESDLHRSTSLCVFKSIYGNSDGPNNAFPLEERFSRPTAYARGSKITEFEQKIWNDFWDISNDPQRALEMGIRANHGQANYVIAQEGMTYQVDLRASDGITIRSLAEGEAPDFDRDAG